MRNACAAAVAPTPATRMAHLAVMRASPARQLAVRLRGTPPARAVRRGSARSAHHIGPQPGVRCHHAVIEEQVDPRLRNHRR